MFRGTGSRKLSVIPEACGQCLIKQNLGAVKTCIPHQFDSGLCYHNQHFNVDDVTLTILLEVTLADLSVC